MATHFSYMTIYETELADVFEKHHYGHDIAYKFHQTGIGQVIDIACIDCDVEQNITDYKSW